ncbi:hypothetical protein H257_17824 [Aphanomyces astaci]|uniref:6-phosphogluconolactonase n=1 Tax=Aphanomyces astaci TaxID=112090 RepID=W4FFD5_APHAT|nr:hypothetical protein H257_17824 [Aphanomyces astaci]ETV65458.1 hypothetical protein H257_17824 [Aphanomyces astaci]RQM31170.1 hypothetical protein B5M09_010105 [Aphanomyces astaci]|eukprot:XP_009845069.1 hypothetical protein H257_17824 [Aphanomyces astaci]
MRLTTALFALAALVGTASSRFLLVGSQTGAATTNDPVGISIYRTNAKGGLTKIGQETNATTGNQPTYFALSKGHKFLYVTNEVEKGTLTAFRVRRNNHDDDDNCEDDSDDEDDDKEETSNEDTLSLDFLGATATNTKGPVHLVLTNDNKYAIVASYDDGSVVVFKLNQNGTVGEIVDKVQFTGGAGVVPGRQEGPHAHCVALSKCNSYLYVTDLGNDKVMQFKLNKGKLTANGFVATGPGTLPRHLAVHPNSRDIFLTTEFTNELVRHEVQPDGQLVKKAVVKTSALTGDQYSAAVHVTKDGKFVLVSNRGLGANENNIVVFDAATLERVSTGPLRAGAFPRDFTISDDNIVYVGNQLTSDLVSFRLLKNGTLVPTGTNVAVPRPVVLLTL